MGLDALFISNTFISNARLKLPKNRVKAKQHSEAELLLSENYSLSSPTLSLGNNWRYTEKMYIKQVRLLKRRNMINENKAEN